MKHILRHLEFWSGLICLLLMALVPLIFRLFKVPDMLNLVLTLVVASAAQLVLLRFIYRRHRIEQDKTVHQIREMLRDRVLNQLTIIWLQVQRTKASESQLNRIRRALDVIETDVSQLSSDSLEKWLNSYQNVLDLDDTQMLKKMVIPTQNTKSA